MPKVSEKPKTAHKGITLSTELNVVSVFIVVNKIITLSCALNWPAFAICTIYTQRARILKAAKVANGSTSGKVVSFSWRPVMDKTKSPFIA